MGTTNSDFDPEAPGSKEIGREMVDQDTGLGSVMAHLYRGEVERMVQWRDRLDSTTNWAVTLLAAIVAYAFAGEASHAVILAGMLMGTIFLFIEARRFRDYDMWRSRVRVIQENLFANALDPSQGVEHERWRATLSEDYREPELKLSFRAAVGHRLRRVYLPLMGAMGVGWWFHRLAFAPGESVFERAAVPGVSGQLVLGSVVLYFVILIVLAVPHDTSERGEASDADHGDLAADE